MVVTFYSFKGGVGRSMAVANVAEILSRTGYSVIVCDWDLEAPGLEHYFSFSREGADRLKSRPGIVDLLGEYKNALRGAPPPREEERADFEERQRVWLRRPSSYALPPLSDPRVRLLSAGKRDGDNLRAYSEFVQTFNWAEFYQDWAGAAYIDFLRQDLERAADIVLVDSRTGFTEHGGVSIHHLADLVILVVAPNDQNLEGAHRMIQTLEVRAKDLAGLRSNRPLQAVPIASRVEILAEEKLINTFRKGFIAAFRPWIELLGVGDAEQFYAATEIPHVPAIAFSERVVAREPDGNLNKTYPAYEGIARMIRRWGEKLGKLKVHEQESRAYLAFALPELAGARKAATALLSGGFTVWPDPGRMEAPSVAGDTAKEIDSANWIVILHGKRVPLPMDWRLRRILLRSAADPSVRIVNVVGEGVSEWSLPEVLRAYPVVALQALEGSAEPLRLAVEPARYRAAAAASASVAQSAPVSTRQSGEFPVRDNPFSPAMAFTEQNAWLFFGRDSETAALVSRLKDSRVLVLAGDAAVGKTSLVQAGLLPALRSEGEPRVTVLVPDHYSSPDADEKAWRLTKQASTFAGEGKCLVIVDQFERVRPSTRAAFADALAKIPGATVLLVARPEGLSGIESLPRFVLAPMETATFPDLIQKLIAVLRAGIEPALVARITEDAGSLCRLQAILYELWNRRSGRVLTLSSYEETGGEKRIAADAADALLNPSASRRQALAKSVLLRLIKENDGAFDTAVAAPLEEVLNIGDSRVETESVLFDLIEGRLLATRMVGGEGVEVAWVQPLLVSSWPRLRSWIDQERKDLLTEREVIQGYRNWVSSGRPDPALLTDTRKLEDALEWRKRKSSNVGAGEIEFIERSRRRRFLSSLYRKSALAIPVYGVTLLALWQGKQLLVPLQLADPDPYTDEVAEQFQVTPEGRPDRDRWWTPPDWHIVPGPEGDPRNGVLVVTGRDTGYLRLGNRALFDFSLTFQGTQLNQTRVFAWLVRLQRDHRSGYVFQLERRGPDVFLTGRVQEKNGTVRPLGDPGGHRIAFLDPIADNDRIDIYGIVRGASFSHKFTLQARDSLDYRQSVGAPIDPIVVEDPKHTFPYGVVGFRLGEPGAVQVDSVYIQPLTK